MRFSEVKSWHYQLQGTVSPSVQADCIVTDLDAGPASAGCRLAYLSVGEAEDYRTYWPKVSDLVFAENPRWKGNYPVRFWHPRWVKIMTDRAQEAQRRGFTGLYLDKCDVVEDLAGRVRGVMLVEYMCLLVNKIAAAVPEMEIIMQNAEVLLKRKSLLGVLDGLAKEDWLYGEMTTGEPNPPGRVVELASQLMAPGLPIVAVEYLDQEADRIAARKWYAANGIPLFLSSEDRELAT